MAGPASNLLMALVASYILRPFHGASTPYHILSSFIVINLVLAIFNAIPIPPLDGSRILFGLLPSRYARSYARLEPYGMVILILLLYLGLAARVVWPLVSILSRLLGVRRL